MNKHSNLKYNKKLMEIKDLPEEKGVSFGTGNHIVSKHMKKVIQKTSKSCKYVSPNCKIKGYQRPTEAFLQKQTSFEKRKPNSYSSKKVSQSVKRDTTFVRENKKETKNKNEYCYLRLKNFEKTGRKIEEKEINSDLQISNLSRDKREYYNMSSLLKSPKVVNNISQNPIFEINQFKLDSDKTWQQSLSKNHIRNMEVSNNFNITENIPCRLKSGLDEKKNSKKVNRSLNKTLTDLYNNQKAPLKQLPNFNSGKNESLQNTCSIEDNNSRISYGKTTNDILKHLKISVSLDNNSNELCKLNKSDHTKRKISRYEYKKCSSETNPVKILVEIEKEFNHQNSQDSISLKQSKPKRSLSDTDKYILKMIKKLIELKKKVLLDKKESQTSSLNETFSFSQLGRCLKDVQQDGSGLVITLGNPYKENSLNCFKNNGKLARVLSKIPKDLKNSTINNDNEIGGFMNKTTSISDLLNSGINTELSFLSSTKIRKNAEFDQLNQMTQTELLDHFPSQSCSKSTLNGVLNEDKSRHISIDSNASPEKCAFIHPEKNSIKSTLNNKFKITPIINSFNSENNCNGKLNNISNSKKVTEREKNLNIEFFNKKLHKINISKSDSQISNKFQNHSDTFRTIDFVERFTEVENNIKNLCDLLSSINTSQPPRSFSNNISKSCLELNQNALRHQELFWKEMGTLVDAIHFSIDKYRNSDLENNIKCSRTFTEVMTQTESQKSIVQTHSKQEAINSNTEHLTIMTSTSIQFDACQENNLNKINKFKSFGGRLQPSLLETPLAVVMLEKNEKCHYNFEKSASCIENDVSWNECHHNFAEKTLLMENCANNSPHALHLSAKNILEPIYFNNSTLIHNDSYLYINQYDIQHQPNILEETVLSNLRNAELENNPQFENTFQNEKYDMSQMFSINVPENHTDFSNSQNVGSNTYINLPIVYIPNILEEEANAANYILKEDYPYILECHDVGNFANLAMYTDDPNALNLFDTLRNMSKLVSEFKNLVNEVQTQCVADDKGKELVKFLNKIVISGSENIEESLKLLQSLNNSFFEKPASEIEKVKKYLQNGIEEGNSSHLMIPFENEVQQILQKNSKEKSRNDINTHLEQDTKISNRDEFLMGFKPDIADCKIGLDNKFKENSQTYQNVQLAFSKTLIYQPCELTVNEAAALSQSDINIFSRQKTSKTANSITLQHKDDTLNITCPTSCTPDQYSHDNNQEISKGSIKSTNLCEERISHNEKSNLNNSFKNMCSNDNKARMEEGKTSEFNNEDKNENINSKIEKNSVTKNLTNNSFTKIEPNPSLDNQKEFSLKRIKVENPPVKKENSCEIKPNINYVTQTKNCNNFPQTMPKTEYSGFKSDIDTMEQSKLMLRDNKNSFTSKTAQTNNLFREIPNDSHIFAKSNKNVNNFQQSTKNFLKDSFFDCESSSDSNTSFKSNFCDHNCPCMIEIEKRLNNALNDKKFQSTTKNYSKHSKERILYRTAIIGRTESGNHLRANILTEKEFNPEPNFKCDVKKTL